VIAPQRPDILHLRYQAFELVNTRSFKNTEDRNSLTEMSLARLECKFDFVPGVWDMYLDNMRQG